MARQEVVVDDRERLEAARERRDRYAAEGRCRCGRPRDAQGVRCSFCLAQERRYKELHAKRRAAALARLPTGRW